jgi:hypothetical protein
MSWEISLSSRITHTKLGEIQRSAMNYWSGRSPALKMPLSLWVADVTLRFANLALCGEVPTTEDPNLLALWKILDQAAKANLREQPAWFAYLEAALHISERMLGAMLSESRGRKLQIAIEKARLRGKPCGAYSTPHFIVQAVLSDVFAATIGRTRLNMLDLSVEAGHFPVSVVASAPPELEINFYAVDRDPIALRLTKRLVSFAVEHSQSRTGKKLFSSCRDSLLDALPANWPSNFDVVLGNPPWAGTKNGYNRTIKDAFAPWLSHNFDLYLAFILRASQYVKPGGTLAFVVPSTLLFNESAVSVREHLLEHYDVISMRLFPRRSFIEVPCLIPIAMVLTKKNGVQSTKKKTLIAYHPHPLGGRFRPRTTSRSFAPEIWSKDPMKSFHPIAGPQYSAFLRHFAELPRLSEYGRVLCSAKLEVEKTLPLKSAFRGFHARDIRIFHACPRGSHVYKINARCFAVPPDPVYLRARKVVFQNFRYMTHERRLVAAAIGPGEYGVSTAAQFIPHEGRLTDFYSALLNSSVVNAWFKLADVSRSIKLTHVRNIPVALDDDLVREIDATAARARGALAVLHDQLERCPNSNGEIHYCGPSRDVYLEFRRDLDYLDKLFLDLYRLSDKQRRMATTLSGVRVF